MPKFLESKSGIYFTKNEYWGRKEFLDGTIDDRIIVQSLRQPETMLPITKKELIEMLALLNQQ